MRSVSIAPRDVPNADTFDGTMREIFAEESHVTFEEGLYKTAGTSEWNRRPDRGFLLNGIMEGPPTAIIEIDPAAIRDEDVSDEPQRIITGRGVWDYVPNFDQLSAQQIWDELPVGQAVRGLTLRPNHSRLIEPWKKAGKSLRTSAILLSGHNAAIEGVNILDCGAWRANPAFGAETFPACITGITGGPDRNAIAALDPATHKYDATGPASHITGSSFAEFHPEASNDQVTVFMLMASMGEVGGFNTGGWRFHWRTDCYQSGNSVLASGSNLVQGFTIYLAERGQCYQNRTEQADVGYYGDYLQTRGIEIHENEFLTSRHGINLLLSPEGPRADTFFHEDYTIGINQITSRDANVSLNTSAADWVKKTNVPVPPTRYIRRIAVDRSLSLENVNNGAENVTRTGVDLNRRRGCSLFHRA